MFLECDEIPQPRCNVPFDGDVKHTLTLGPSSCRLLQRSLPRDSLVQGWVYVVSAQSRSARKPSLETIPENILGSRESEVYTSGFVACPQHMKTSAILQPTYSSRSLI